MRKSCKFTCLSIVFLLAFVLGAHGAWAFEFRGFGDVTFTESTKTDNDQGAFALGQLDFYATQRIDERSDVFVEVVVEADDTGEFVIDLERLQLGYLVNDYLKVRAGRFHNTLGFWNTEYHHGAQLQTTIGRPEFLEFEDDGGILPSHMVGIWATGRYRTAPATFNYGVMVGNGSKVQDGALDPNNASDNSGNKAVTLRLTVEPEAVSGLALGLSAGSSVVSGFSGSDEVMRVKQRILEFDVTYFRKPFEFMAEYYMIRNKDDFGAGDSHTSSAYYVQGGYWLTERFIPYARYEKVSVKEEDPYFTALGTADSNRVIAGVRYDLSLSNTVKAEVRFIDDGSQDFEEYALQWAIAF